MVLGKLKNYNDETGFTGGLPVMAPYVLQDQLDTTNYDNIHSIANLDLYGLKTGCDFKLLRTELKIVVEAQAGSGYSTFMSMAETDRIIACKYLPNKIPPASFIATIPLASDRIDILNNFDTKSVRSRADRYLAVRRYIMTKLTIANSLELLKDAHDSGLISKYRDGIEGTLSGDPEGLFDFMEAQAGTSFENTGLAARAYTPIDGSSLASVVTGCMNILREGKYVL